MDLSQLALPFPAKDIEWRVGATTEDKKKGIALAYVTNRAIQNRLDAVCEQFGWKNEYKEWHEKSQICGISIYNENKKEWITKWDGADNTEYESTKGGLSDSMKRAGYQWGIGRYLYNLPNKWVTIKQRGKSYVLCEIPTMPDEFLPEDERGKKPERKKNLSNQDTSEKQKIKPDQAIELDTIIKDKGYTFKELLPTINKAEGTLYFNLDDITVDKYENVKSGLKKLKPKK